MTLAIFAVAVLIAGMEPAPAPQDRVPVAAGATGLAQPTPVHGGQAQDVQKKKDGADNGSATTSQDQA
jgi:hypothetical protein